MCKLRYYQDKKALRISNGRFFDQAYPDNKRKTKRVED